MYWWAILAAFVGLLSGFQGVVERYPKDIGGAARSRFGLLYLLTRAVIPAAVFWAILYYGALALHPAALALSVGVGAEAILRTQFFLKQRTKDDGTTEELQKGPFDLVRWYQNLLLKHAGYVVGRRRRDFVLSNLPPDLTAAELAIRVLDRLKIDVDSDDQKERIKDIAAKAEAEWAEVLAQDREPASAIIARHRERFGYALRAIVNDHQFETLLADPPANQ